MNARQVDIVSAVSILALVCFGFYQTSLIDLTLSSELETFTGPRAYPRIVLSGILLLVLLQLGKLWIDRHKQADVGVTLAVHPRLTKVCIALLALVIFTAVFEPLGYLITIVPLLITFGYLNGADNFFRTVVFSIVASAVCLLVFRYGLNTLLPEGLLGIDQIF